MNKQVTINEIYTARKSRFNEIMHIIQVEFSINKVDPMLYLDDDTRENHLRRQNK